MYASIEWLRMGTQSETQLLTLAEQVYSEPQIQTLKDNMIQLHEVSTVEIDKLYQSGFLSFQSGDLQKALKSYQDALSTLNSHKNLSFDLDFRALVLRNIAPVYFGLDNYFMAFASLDWALRMEKLSSNSLNTSNQLNNLGTFYSRLGQDDQAIDFYSRALDVDRQYCYRSFVSTTLNNLGSSYFQVGQTQKAVDLFTQSIFVRGHVDFNTLHNLSLYYSSIGQSKKAIALSQKAVQLLTPTRSHVQRASLHLNLGHYYSDIYQWHNAFDNFQQSLSLSSNSRYLQAANLRGIANVLTTQEKIPQAIALYKYSVNLTESLRGEVSGFNSELQQSFTQTITLSYRELATLLLQEGRVVEALQALDLLKVQELQDFYKDVNGNERTSQGIALFPEEEQILSFVNSSRTDNLTVYFQRHHIEALGQKLKATAKARNLSLPNYDDLNTRLNALSPDSALLYPLLLDDRLELILFTPNSPPIRRTVGISETQVRENIKDYRQSLQNPNDSKF